MRCAESPDAVIRGCLGSLEAVLLLVKGARSRFVDSTGLQFYLGRPATLHPLQRDLQFQAGELQSQDHLKHRRHFALTSTSSYSYMIGNEANKGWRFRISNGAHHHRCLAESQSQCKNRS